MSLTKDKDMSAIGACVACQYVLSKHYQVMYSFTVYYQIIIKSNLACFSNNNLRIQKNEIERQFLPNTQST